MSGFGQLAVATAFAIVGNFLVPGIGGPIGFVIGSYVGGAIFPQKFNGPQLSDTRIQGSSYGNSIPITYGTCRVGGTVVDRPLKFTQNEHTDDGKGGPEVTTFSYSVAYLSIVLCESRGDHSLWRIWANGELVDDWRDGSTVTEHLPLIFYNGADDQEPDPTEEAIHGVGTISAYRRVARVVFTNLDLSRWGNTIPQFNFELSRGATHADHPITLVVKNNNDPSGHQWPSTTGAFDSWHNQSPAVISWPTSGDEAIRVRAINSGTDTHLYDATTLEYLGSETAAAGDAWPSDVEGVYIGLGYYVYADGTRTPLWACPQFRVDGTVYTGPTYHTGPPISSSIPIRGSGGSSDTFTGSNFLLAAGCTGTDRLKRAALSQDGKMLFVGVTTAAQAAINDSVVDKWYRIVDGEILDTGGPVNQSGAFFGPNTRTSEMLQCAAFENDYKTCWIVPANAQKMYVYAINEDTGAFGQVAVHEVAGDPDGGLGLTGDVNPGGGWYPVTAIYALSGGCRAGYVSGKSLWLCERCAVTSGQMWLSEVAADICTRSKLTIDQQNVDDIDDIPTRGLLLDQTPITGRAALEAVLPDFLVRAFDSFGVATFVKAGKASVVTIPSDDLAYHMQGEELPARLHTDRGSDENIPAQITLNFPNAEADYQKGSQASPRRMVGESTGVTVMSTAVTLIDDEAKQLVDAWARIAVDERDPFLFYTGRKYIEYEVTDVMTVEGIDIWITDKTENVKGKIEWRGRRSRRSSYSRGGTAGTSNYIPQTIPTPQGMLLRVIDGPFPQEGREGVIQMAVQPMLRRSSTGATIYRSTDGGTNWTRMFSTPANGTTGEALTVLPNYGGSNTLDTLSHASLLIYPGGGDLVSVTREEAEIGANLMMWGAEAVAPCNIELVGETSEGKEYLCSRFLRGLNGTGWAMRGHVGREDSPAVTGDLVTLMSTAVVVDVAFAEYGQTELYKAVTNGRALTTATPVSFTHNGISRAPWSPVHLRIGITASGDWRMRCMERMRLNNAWLDFVDVPRDEPTEKFRFRVWQDGSFQTVKREIIVQAPTDFASGDPDAVYTAAMQTTDFGAPLTVAPAWSVAKWGALGWGYETLSSGAWAALPLFVPSTIGGFIPPNPDPADGINSVMPWVEATRIFSGSMSPNDNWYIEFTTGATPSGGGGLVTLDGAEYAGPLCSREWCLSPVKGDFAAAYTGAMPGSKGGGTSSVTAKFVVGSGSDFGYYPTVPLSSTWYLNIRNQATTYSDVPMFCDLLNVP